MRRLIRYPAVTLALAFALSGTGRPAAVDGDRDVQKKKDLIHKVATRLLAVADRPAGMEWPPDIAYVASPDVNAFAAARRKDGKVYPVVRVFDGIMTKVIKGDEDRLAFVLGHELGHILKGHVLNRKGDTALLEYAFSRANEEEADMAGAELAVKAGYSLAKGVRMVTEMQDLGLEHSSFEGLDATHPSWSDRARRIDKEKAHLWKALSAFHNGAVFLATEQYPAAEQCFDRVTKEFPDSYEGWADLGYACLMEYCDKLDEKDLRDYEIGQVITGGFYFRPESIRVRGKDAKGWAKAETALLRSDKLKPGQTLVLANLGLAYLVHPAGKKVAEAGRYLTAAAAAAAADPFVNPITNAGVLVNLGIAKLAGGDVAQGFAELDRGEKMAEAVGLLAGPRRAFPTFGASVQYTRAITLAKSKGRADREKAVAMFEDYLRTSSPLSLWWAVAFDRYEQTCQDLNRKAIPRGEFKTGRPEPLRLVAGVKLKSGAEITLSEDVEDVEKRVGKGKETAAAAGTGLRRIRYEDDGVELLAREEVLAIALTDAKALPLPLRGKVVGAGRAGAVRVGMSVKEAEALLGDDYQPSEIAAAGLFYRFYRDQGLALRVVKDQVREVVVVQVPSR